MESHLRILEKIAFTSTSRFRDETDTKDEKALYIKEAFDELAEILGNLHEVSYIYAQDVKPASYGYGGHTQEYRYHR